MPFHVLVLSAFVNGCLSNNFANYVEKTSNNKKRTHKFTTHEYKTGIVKLSPEMFQKDGGRSQGVS